MAQCTARCGNTSAVLTGMNFNSPILTLKYYKQPTYTHNTTTIVPNPRKHILHETAILTGMNFISPILTLCAQVNLTPTIQQFNILPNPRKTCDMKHVKQQSWQGWILALHFWLRSSIPNSVLGQPTPTSQQLTILPNPRKHKCSIKHMKHINKHFKQI